MDQKTVAPSNIFQKNGGVNIWGLCTHLDKYNNTDSHLEIEDLPDVINPVVPHIELNETGDLLQPR